MCIQQRDHRLNGVNVDVTGQATIHLSGTVRSFYLRQLAVAIARQNEDVRYVSDGILVTVPLVSAKPR
jgi:hypothetical protein